MTSQSGPDTSDTTGRGMMEEASCSPTTFPLSPDYAGEAGLRRTTALVESLVTSSHSARSFPGKWQSIRARLDQLSSILASAAATARSTSIGNLVLQELLQEIAATVAETHDLARLCTAGGPSSNFGGKLLMRSNLDLAIAKIELHVRSLAGIYSSGILTPSSSSSAIVASRPAGGASRDDVRLYVGNVVSRLRIGNSDMKARALVALNEAFREDERFVRAAVVAKTPEVLSLLAGLLEVRDVGVQQEAAEAVSVVAGFEAYRQALVMAGMVAPLVQVVESGTRLGKERAARALKKLTENSNNAWLVASHGGVTALLRVCGDPETGSELMGSGCGVLRNLAVVEEIRRFMVEEGAVSVFLEVMRTRDDEVSQIHAIEFLQSIASDDEKARTEAVSEGVIESLVRMLDPNSPSSSKARETALRAIESLSCSGNSVTALISSGFLDRALLLLKSGEISVQESALKAAWRFCGASEEARREMGEVGFMPELVKLLESPGESAGVREMAAKALSSIVSVQRNQRRFVQEEQSVSKIMEVLNHADERPVTRKFLLSALASLSDSNAGRRKIAASGYLKSLERMAESDGSDAKRIVKKLTGGRLRSLLHGIWS